MKPSTICALICIIIVGCTASYNVGAAPAGSVSSVFGRTGNITARAGDYSFNMISGTALPSQLPSGGGGTGGSSFDPATLAGVYATLAGPNTFEAGTTFKSSSTAAAVRLVCGPKPTTMVPLAIYCTPDGELWIYNGQTSRKVVLQ